MPKHPKNYKWCAAYRRRLKKRAFDVIGWKCIWCGTKKDIHAAHVIPTRVKGMSRGLDRRFRDVIQNPKSYRPMCGPGGNGCHRTFDMLTRALMQAAAGTAREEEIPF